jgi:chemotaxis protein methyltransferase CheR
VSQTVPTIEAAEYTQFQELFYRKTGIVFGESKRYFVDRRLADRMLATGATSVGAYLAMLQRDNGDRELQNLVNVMTVNETYFDREAYQFRCLVQSLLPELVAGRRHHDPLRIWSMPCSTGEEAYSIAIHLLDGWSDVDAWDVRLLATDIDTRVIEQAREGIYDTRALQHVPPRRLDRFFRPVGVGRWQVIAEMRRSIEFRQANIMCEADMRGYRDIDVIFCRNLLIYFDETSRHQAIAALHSALRPGGFICLGHSETMGRAASLFTPRKFPDALVYQKPHEPAGTAARGRA